MAGSRLEKLGTIFSRAQGLLRSGAVKYQDRPIWYDIYRVFPPKYEPTYDRKTSLKVEDVPDILYKEDKIRARYFKTFGLNDGKPRRLNDRLYEDPSQEFVQKCNEKSKSHPEWNLDEICDVVEKEYKVSRPQSRVVAVQGKRRGRGGGSAFNEKIPPSFDADSGGDSATSELLGKSKKVNIVTKDSLRALFEEATVSKGDKDK